MGVSVEQAFRNMVSAVKDLTARVYALERKEIIQAMVKIEEQTASASATLDFDLPTGYSYFVLALRNLKPATDAVDLWLRMSIDGGATFIATATYGYHTQGSAASVATYAAVNSTGAAQIVLCGGSQVGNAADESVNGKVELWNMDSTVNKKNVTFHMALTNLNGTVFHEPGSGDQDTTSAVNAVRVMFSSGNIASGTVALYGIT